MGVCAANMQKCDRKAKCYFGPNEGKAYDPKDPCCGDGKFNADKCDCEPDDQVSFVRIILSGSVNNLNYESGKEYVVGTLAAPYYDSQGRYVQEYFSFLNASTWPGTCGYSQGPSFPPSIWDCMMFSGGIQGTKDRVCTGGSIYWLDFIKTTYVNGEYSTLEDAGGLTSGSGSACSAPVGSKSAGSFRFEQFIGDAWQSWNPPPPPDEPVGG